MKTQITEPVRILFRREMAAPLAALAFASAVSIGLIVGRIGWMREFRYSFLAWNLVLAWVPLILALLTLGEYERRRRLTRRLVLLGFAWLLFFPNSPYLFTDLVHVTRGMRAHFWPDLILVLTSAMTGLVLGFVSLFVIQTVVRRALGGAASWLFVLGAAGLGGVGICLGRFLRFNSWDVLVKPAAIVKEIGSAATSVGSSPSNAVIPLLFTAFLFTVYLLLYALTHISHFGRSRPDG